MGVFVHGVQYIIYQNASLESKGQYGVRQSLLRNKFQQDEEDPHTQQESLSHLRAHGLYVLRVTRCVCDHGLYST